jgi:hypothetical protein
LLWEASSGEVVDMSTVTAMALKSVDQDRVRPVVDGVLPCTSKQPRPGRRSHGTNCVSGQCHLQHVGIHLDGNKLSRQNQRTTRRL